jgi:hypothetical protein
MDRDTGERGMNRRDILKGMAAAAVAPMVPAMAAAQVPAPVIVGVDMGVRDLVSTALFVRKDGQWINVTTIVNEAEAFGAHWRDVVLREASITGEGSLRPA